MLPAHNPPLQGRDQARPRQPAVLAADVIEILREARRLTGEARARGDPPDAEQLDKLRQRYDEAVASGIIHNRPPTA
jgi:hypothetical protein